MPFTKILGLNEHKQAQPKFELGLPIPFSMTINITQPLKYTKWVSV